MNVKEIAPILKVLSDETRLCIVSLLLDGDLCACDLLTHFNITQPTLSYHMKQLRSIELVTSEKDGQWVRYNLNLNRYQQVIDFFNHQKTCCRIETRAE